MKNVRSYSRTAGLILIGWLFITAGPAAHAALSTAFAYQGRLTAGGSPANTVVDLRLTLYPASFGGLPMGPVITNANVAVSNGLFNTTLDFGPGIFDGSTFWLETAIRPAGSTAGFSPLLPRQPVTGAPFAFFASNATFAQTAAWSGLIGVPPGFADNTDQDTTYGPGAGLHLIGTTFAVDFAGTGGANTVARSDHAHLEPLINSRLSGIYSNPLTFSNPGNLYQGSGANLTGLNAGNITQGTLASDRLEAAVALDSEIGPLVLANDGPGSGLDADLLDGREAAGFWQLDGNAGSIPGTHYLGTSDNRALEFRVNNATALRMEPRDNGPNVIGGSSDNDTIGNIVGVAISGGVSNVVAEHFATIGGGLDNHISNQGSAAVIPGGQGALARHHGQLAHAGGYFAGRGDAQRSVYVLRNETLNSLPAELFLNGVNRRLVIPVNGRWCFDAHIMATAGDGSSGGFHAQGVIKRVGNTVTLVGPVNSFTAGTIAADVMSWTVTVAANDAQDALTIIVANPNGNPVRWVARVETVEVIF